MKKSIEKAQQKEALDAAKAYGARITVLETDVAKLKIAVNKLLKASKVPRGGSND